MGGRKTIYSSPPIGSPDGGATVTALDLDRFIRAIHHGTLMGADASAELLSPHVKRRDTVTGTSLWNGFAFEFEKDAEGEIIHCGKDGINAGVCAYARFYPASGTTVILLSNEENDVWAMQDQMRQVITGRFIGQ